MTHINALISLTAHFAYYGILAIAKSKKGMNNLLAEWRSVARSDSILGLLTCVLNILDNTKICNLHL